MRRVRFEARVQALEIWSVMAQSMGERGDHVPPEAMIAMMGGF
jgi:hypothetical protein